MSKIVTTAQKLISDLKTLESRPTFYKNKWPDNLLYVHDDGRTSADCVNLYKALFNGYNINVTKAGYYQHDLSNTGDCDEWGLLSQCSDISQDFAKLKNGEPRILYMNGHIGGFVGEFEKYGHIYNVVECTAAWSKGILFSYVDSKGNRYKSKGGQKNKSWTHHGKPTKWVDYSQSFDTFDGDMQPVKPPVKPTPTKPSVQDRHEGSTAAHYRNEKKYSRAYKVNVNSGLNLRQGIGTSTRSLGVLPYGTMVRCFGYYDYDKDGNLWLYVGSPLDVGFVRADHLE